MPVVLYISQTWHHVIDVIFLFKRFEHKNVIFWSNGLNIGVAPIMQVTHVANKNSNSQGRSLNVMKVIFHAIRDCS